MSEPYLSIVLPAYNEAGAIRNTLDQVRAFLDRQAWTSEVIVSSQGEDETPDIVREIAADWPSLRLTAARGRLGKGRGVRSGMALASGQIVGFMDADYKTPIENLLAVLPSFSEGYQLVIGSRARRDSDVQVRQPGYRQAGARAFSVAMHLVVGLHEVTDTQCGFKFMTREVAREIFARTRIDAYMIDVEILWLASMLGYRIKEVGISWQDDGDSRLRLVRDIALDGFDLFRIRLGRYGRAREASTDEPTLSS